MSKPYCTVRAVGCFCLWVCTVAMSSTLYYVEDAAVISNRLVVVIERSTSKYHQTLGDKIFGDPGRLTERGSTFFYCPSTQELSTDVPLVFGKPISLLTVKGNELASLCFTCQKDVICYRLSLEKEIGYIEVSKGRRMAITPAEGLSHTDCGSADGLLLWQDGASLWTYDLLKKEFASIGTTPLSGKDNAWFNPMHPLFMNAFYSKGAIFQWRDGEGCIRKYATATGAPAGVIAEKESAVYDVGQTGDQVYCAFISKQGVLRFLDEESEELAVFSENVDLSASRHHVLLFGEKKLLMVVDKDIHPRERCVTVRLMDCLQKRTTTQKIKIPSSL